MAKPKRPRDPSQLAKLIVDISTGQALERADRDPRNAGAVALGRMGGLRGGKRRMDSLTKAERKDLALKAARARWSKKRVS